MRAAVLRFISLSVSALVCAALAAPVHADRLARAELDSPAAKRTDLDTPAKPRLFGWFRRPAQKQQLLSTRAAHETAAKSAAELVEQYGSVSLARKIAKLELSAPKTFGQRVAEKVTDFSGSWGYLMGGLVTIGGWTYMGVTGHHFFSPDVLNLGISIATWAVGPMLMMAQNRQARLDRQRQDALLLLLLETERESRHTENQLKTALAENRELHAKVANVDLKLDKLTSMLEGKQAPTTP
jgi:uncharacterized membrane protein